MAMMMNDFRNSQEQEFRDELAAGQPAHVSQNHQRKVILILFFINLKHKLIDILNSFAAIFDNNDVLFEFAKKLSQFRYGENDCPGNNFINKLSALKLDWISYHF